MARVVRDEFELAVEREEEAQARSMALSAEARRMAHELRLAKLKYATQPRYKSIERVIQAIAKAPALGIALVCITVLVLKGKDVPESLSKFIAV